MLQKEVGVLLTPPTGKEKADDWQGLETVRQLQIKFENVERCDLNYAYNIILYQHWFSILVKVAGFRYN